MSKKTYLHFGAVGLAIGLSTILLVHGQHNPNKTHGSMTHESMEEMNKRGDKAMGFDQMQTTHHVLLAKDGGVIQVEANKASDKASRGQIQLHLRHIAIMFSNGNFDSPMFVHAEDPPGIEVMKQLKGEINYKFEEIKRGGRVRISSNNADAIKAIHDFLNFQIKEHRTGDPLKVVE